MSSTSTSDHEMSDYSSSPQSYTVKDSPNSSPSQHVPQITNYLTELTCVDKVNGLVPQLQIIKQPQSHFRFRYTSEMMGTHGCILANSQSPSNKEKAFPTVELINYTGKAVIRCSLAQHDKPDEHPHELMENEQDVDVSYNVPEDGSYRVTFPGMGIIHTAKKDVKDLLFKKFTEQLKALNKSFDAKQLLANCESLAKNIDLNIVRLKFSAHYSDSDKEICKPVFSEPIYNLKSAATNDLKICRMSACQGRPRGCEDIFILVEKVNKKKIKIRFFELDADGKEVWSAFGKFSESDVHHQYAIVFSTPPYINPQTSIDVKVYIELLRTSDNRRSNRMEFTYKAEQVYKQIKKRKNNSPYSSLDSDSSGSLTNMLTTIPTLPILNNRQEMPVQMPTLNHSALPLLQSNSCGLGAALGGSLLAPAPQWAQATPLPNITLDSKELDEITDRITMDERLHDDSTWFKVYCDSFNSLSDLPSDEVHQLHHMQSDRIVADSGRVKVEPSSSDSMEQTPDNNEDEKDSEYPAFYKVEDGPEVKQLVKEICDIIRGKKIHDNRELRDKFERLFQLRLSNGDTFLHMALWSNEPSFESIVKVIHGVKMTHLLNYANNKKKTILHLAITHGTPKLVALLVSKGCDPMLKDIDEDNAIHYAVKHNPECLEPMLQALDTHKVKYDLNEYNGERLTALHLCVSAGRAQCVAALAARGADVRARAAAARTALHLAAHNARTAVLKELLDNMPQSEVDAVDGLGNTALQIVCGSSYDEHSEEMVRLLLKHKADPLRHEEFHKSAWWLARDKPALAALLPAPPAPRGPEPGDQVKSEPEDDYESAEEDDPPECLSGLSRYISPVSAILDARGEWRALAGRLRASSLADWLAMQPSPATALLLHVKECGDDVTSKSLALILDDMGLKEAASIVRSNMD